MYNHDVLGSRYNPGEKAIGRDNAGRLEEKWRFPAKGSGQEIGVIHATPVVVDGYVYFGTATATPTFYKLTPDGKVRWSYRNPEFGRGPAQPEAGRDDVSPDRALPAVYRWGHLRLGAGHRRHRLLRATWRAGSTRWTGRPGRSVGS